MAQDPRRGRQNEDSGRALVPADSASLSTMIGAMLIGLSATDVAYREAAARSVDRATFDPSPAAHRPGDQKHDESGEAPGHVPFQGAEDPEDVQVAPHPVMEVLPPPPNFDPWSRFDALDAKVVDVVDEGAQARGAGASGVAAAEPASPAEAAAPSVVAATHEVAGTSASVAPSLTSAQDIIGETMAGLDAAVDHIAASVSQIVQPLTNAVETTVEQITSAAEAIGETVGAVGATLDGVTALASDLPEALLGGKDAPAIPDPVFAEAFKPDLSDSLPHPGAVQDIVDTGLGAVGSVTGPLHLGFLGQSTMDGMDAHDGAFSIFGSHI